MKLSFTAAAVLAATPAVVTAAGYQAGTLGFALGTKKPDGSCKTQSDYEDDFDTIEKSTTAKLVRGYAASDCNCAQNILPAAKAKNFKVILGVWPDTDESFNLDKEALQKYATKYTDQIYAVTVGSETMYRGNFTGAELLSKMNEVRDILPNTKLGSADSWNMWADGTGDDFIKGKPDLILANAFAYWQGQEVKNASHTYFDDLFRAFTHIQEVAGSTTSIELWNGETGWPTDGGSDYDAAIAGTDNAQTFWKQGVCAMLDWGFNVFYFEAFDEPWKPESVGDNGVAKDERHWGAMTSDRQKKWTLSC